MPRADWKVLLKYSVVLPPLEILHQFNNLVKDMVANIHNLIFSNRKLCQTRDLPPPQTHLRRD